MGSQGKIIGGSQVRSIDDFVNIMSAVYFGSPVCSSSESSSEDEDDTDAINEWRIISRHLDDSSASENVVEAVPKTMQQKELIAPKLPAIKITIPWKKHADAINLAKRVRIPCEKCSKTFKTKATLNGHLKQHRGGYVQLKFCSCFNSCVFRAIQR